MPADRVEQRVRAQFLAGRQRGADRVVVTARYQRDALDLFVQAQTDACTSDFMLKGFPDFLIQKAQQAFARLDQRDADAERCQDAGIFGADHATAHDDHGARQIIDLQQRIRADDPALVERHIAWSCGLGAGRDDEFIGADFRLLGAVIHRQLVLAREARRAREQIDMVAVELPVDLLHLVLDHAVRHGGEVFDRDVALDPVGRAEQPALAGARQIKHGLAQRFRGDRARVDTGAPQLFAFFDHDGALAELRGLNGRALPGWAAADDREIVLPVH